MDVYQQDETPALRRGLWRLLWFVAVALVLWLLVWLLFFRQTTPEVSQKTNTSNSKSTSNQEKPATGSTPKPNPSPNPNAGTAPNQLADTGAGNVLLPVAAATVAGMVLYHVRLRRKLLAE